jgi:hypothetical protein
MATNSPKHVNPRDVARLLGISPSQVKAIASASASATARTSIRMLNDDILGKVMGEYMELVKITTHEERLIMLEYIVGKLESKLNSKQDFLNDISNGIGYDEDITPNVNEVNGIFANARESIRKIRVIIKRANKYLDLFKKPQDIDIIKDFEQKFEIDAIYHINNIGTSLKSANRLILRIKRLSKDNDTESQNWCGVS